MFIRPTLTELRERTVSDIQTYTIGQESTVNSLARRAVLRVVGYVIAGMSHLMFGFMQWAVKQLFVTSAERTYLEIHGSEIGVAVKYGEYATGSCIVSGTAGKTIPSGRELINSTTGLKYTVDSDVTIPVGGSAYIDVTASNVGDDYNESVGGTLKFVSPILGVSTTATITTAIAGGTDEETEDQYRARVLRRKRQPPHGGAEFDYEDWALEVSGVTRAWSFPQYQGVGTIGIAFVRDNDDEIIPDSTERATVQSYLEEHNDPLTGLTVGAPVGAVPGIIMIELSFLDVNFDIDIYPNNGTVQSNIQTRLEDYVLSLGPGDTARYSDMMSTISQAVGLEYFKLNTPADDFGVAQNKLPQLGTITYGDY